MDAFSGTASLEFTTNANHHSRRTALYTDDTRRYRQHTTSTHVMTCVFSSAVIIMWKFKTFIGRLYIYTRNKRFITINQCHDEDGNDDVAAFCLLDTYIYTAASGTYVRVCACTKCKLQTGIKGNTSPEGPCVVLRKGSKRTFILFFFYLNTTQKPSIPWNLLIFCNRKI